jgi:hypothetical protein
MPYALLFTTLSEVYEAEFVLQENNVKYQMISSAALDLPESDACGEMALIVGEKKFGELFEKVRTIEVPENYIK